MKPVADVGSAIKQRLVLLTLFILPDGGIKLVIGRILHACKEKIKLKIPDFGILMIFIFS
jgi:hypothetical protein